MAYISFDVPEGRKNTSVPKLCVLMGLTILMYLTIMAEMRAKLTFSKEGAVAAAP